MVTISRSISLSYGLGARMHCPQYVRSFVGFVHVPLAPVESEQAFGNFTLIFFVGLVQLSGDVPR